MSSQIEWTDETWNPTVGCSRVSPGCDHCYAIRVAAREMQDAHRGLTSDGDWTGEVRLLPDRLDTPLSWRKPRRVFVDSMSDLFHPDVPDQFIGAAWDTMRKAEQHTFQVLTKRPQRMANLCGRGYANGAAGGPLPNVWLGTSVENQRYADLRIPHLLATPAAVRFLSIEPLLGPVDITDYIEPDWIGSSAGGSGAPHPLVDWVIVGGESGPGARPMHPGWVRSIRDQCVAAGVPFFFKQWGEWAPAGFVSGVYPERMERKPTNKLVPWHDDLAGEHWRMDWTIHRVGKKAAGRTLDGRTWDEMPGQGA